MVCISAFGGFDKVYSPDDLKASFEDKKVEIYELKHYFNKIVPENRFVEIEFSGDNELFRFGIKALDSTAGDISGPMFLEWDLSTQTAKMDSLIKPIGWSRATLAWCYRPAVFRRENKKYNKINPLINSY